MEASRNQLTGGFCRQALDDDSPEKRHRDAPFLVHARLRIDVILIINLELQRIAQADNIIG